MNTVVPVSVIEIRLAKASTPQETKDIEIYAMLARQYAEEMNDYNLMVSATRLYFDARRKTTELVMPYISHGGDPRSHAATLADFSITKQEWSRRQKEYGVPDEKAHEYFDNCIAKGWNPSIAGIIKYAEGKQELDPQIEYCICPHCRNEHRRFIP